MTFNLFLLLNLLILITKTSRKSKQQSTTIYFVSAKLNMKFMSRSSNAGLRLLSKQVKTLVAVLRYLLDSNPLEMHVPTNPTSLGYIVPLFFHKIALVSNNPRSLISY